MLFIPALPEGFCLVKNDTTIKGRLERISRQMNQEGKLHFIIVEALKDSLIKSGIEYIIDMNPAGFFLNGRRVPDSLDDRYVALIKEHYKQHPYVSQDGHIIPVIDNHGFIMKGTIELDSVLIATSEFRTSVYYRTMRLADNSIRAEMLRDGIGEGPDPHISLLYNKNGLLVNGKPLLPALDAKYRQMFKDLNWMAPKHNDSVSWH